MWVQGSYVGSGYIKSDIFHLIFGEFYTGNGRLRSTIYAW